MNEAFGMMDEGYFKPRSEILKFINDLLRVNVTKVESLGQGAVYCQILDAMYSGKVPLSKVNWKAKLEWEFVNNLKILQSSFTKIGIKRVIEVEKLSKCKYQDNLEMIQWLMRFYECNCNRPPGDYDAVAKRKGIEPDFSYSDKIVIPKLFNVQTNKTMEKPIEKPEKPEKMEKTLNTPTLKKSIENNIPRRPASDKEATKPRNQPAVFKITKNLTPSEKIESITKVIKNLDISDSDKVSQISKIIGIKKLASELIVVNGEADEPLNDAENLRSNSNQIQDNQEDLIDNEIIDNDQDLLGEEIQQEEMHQGEDEECI